MSLCVQRLPKVGQVSNLPSEHPARIGAGHRPALLLSPEFRVQKTDNAS